MKSPASGGLGVEIAEPSFDKSLQNKERPLDLAEVLNQSLLRLSDPRKNHIYLYSHQQYY